MNIKEKIYIVVLLFVIYILPIIYYYFKIESTREVILYWGSPILILIFIGLTYKIIENKF